MSSPPASEHWGVVGVPPHARLGELVQATDAVSVDGYVVTVSGCVHVARLQAISSGGPGEKYGPPFAMRNTFCCVPVPSPKENSQVPPPAPVALKVIPAVFE